MPPKTPAKLRMTKIISSNMESYAYDPENKVFHAKFKSSDTIWKYADVPPETVQDFLKADSKGSFFAKAIKGKFKSEKLEN